MSKRKRKSENVLDIQCLVEKAKKEASGVRYGMNSVNASRVASKCERALWYSFRWCTPVEFEGATLLTFERGHLAEDRVVNLLREAGFEVVNVNPKAKNPNKQYRGEALGGLISGYVDGFIRGKTLGDEWHVLEIKSLRSGKYHYDKSDTTYSNPLTNRCSVKHPTASGNTPDVRGLFFQVRDKGVESVKPEHYGQIQTYIGFARDGVFGEEFSKIRNGIYVGMRVPFNPAWYEAAKRRSIRLSRNDVPERAWEAPMYGDCRFCDHEDACHKGHPFAHRSCRNCAHVECKVPSVTKGYFGSRVLWTCSKHGSSATARNYVACDDYNEIEEKISF
jgi:hypothetical protein